MLDEGDLNGLFPDIAGGVVDYMGGLADGELFEDPEAGIIAEDTADDALTLASANEDTVDADMA